MVIAAVHFYRKTVHVVSIENVFRKLVIMGTEFKDAVVDMSTEDSGNSCGSSVVSDQTDIYDGDGVQVSDLEESVDQRDDALNLEQVGGFNNFLLRNLNVRPVLSEREIVVSMCSLLIHILRKSKALDGSSIL